MAQIKTITGKSQENMACPDGLHAQDLILQICKQYGDALTNALLDEHGRLRRVILVFINDEQLAWDDNPRISNNADICFMSPIAGGN